MFKNFITRENLGHRFVQLLILLAHLALLKWILYTLYEGGVLPTMTLIYHFAGISVAGAFLIFTCARYYRRQYEKEQALHAHRKQLDH